MSHSADVVNDYKNKTRGVEEKTLEKGLAHILPGEGRRSLWVLGELVTYKISSHKTGGAYSLFEVASLSSTGPPPHIHHREDESFYVLEGEYEFLSGREILRAGAGSLLYIPKGILHTHKNIGEGVSRMLLTQTPGGLYEHFFGDVGKAVDDDSGPPVFEEQQDVGSVIAKAAKYGIEIPPPITEEARTRFTSN
jgi:mannose-6-phosphate isomerase-like protein (cupin superfamily)